MARPLRLQLKGAVYHVSSRGNANKPIFLDEQDRAILLNILADVTKKYRWFCHAYCLMNNHYHLIIETPEGNLSKGMKQLNGVYTQMFNKIHNSVGHVFQGRFRAIMIEKDRHLLEACRYIVLNPLRSGIVQSPKLHRWSSYAGTAGLKKPHLCLTTEWILRQFAKTKQIAEKKYREYIEAGFKAESVWKNVKGKCILGGEDFIESLIHHMKGYKDVKEIPKNQRYVYRPELNTLFYPDIRGDRNRRKQQAIVAVERYGYSQKEIADFLGIHYSVVSKMIKR